MQWQAMMGVAQVANVSCPQRNQSTLRLSVLLLHRGAAHICVGPRVHKPSADHLVATPVQRLEVSHHGSQTNSFPGLRPYPNLWGFPGLGSIRG